MGVLGRGGAGDEEITPLVRTARNPPKAWARVEIEDDALVVRLVGWRAVWAMQRGLRIPFNAIVGISHDPDVYQHISTKLRRSRRARTTLFKLGAQHGQEGWSFWASGMARNAIVIENSGVRYRYVILEVEEPVATVRRIRQAAGLPTTAVFIPPRVSSRPQRPRWRGNQESV